MRIKKKTSLMMIAASTAAVVGVAAVSFAAWTGSNNNITAQAATGSAQISGFADDVAINLGKLVPVDQDVDTIRDDSTTFVSVPLTEFAVTDNFTITVTSETELSFYVNVGAAITAAPAYGEDGVVTANGWKLVTSSTAESLAVFEFTVANVAGEMADNGIVKTVNKNYSAGSLKAETTGEAVMYINLVLVSNDKADMNQSNISFNITLAQ